MSYELALHAQSDHHNHTTQSYSCQQHHYVNCPTDCINTQRLSGNYQFHHFGTPNITTCVIGRLLSRIALVSHLIVWYKIAKFSSIATYNT